MIDLSGKKAPLTGARGGLGGAIAREIAVRNAHVAVSGRNECDCAPVGDAWDGTGKLKSALDAVSGSSPTAACFLRRGTGQTGSFVGLHRETVGAGS